MSALHVLLTRQVTAPQDLVVCQVRPQHVGVKSFFEALARRLLYEG